MPKGMKTCPKCESTMAPATKICSSCSYVFSKKAGHTLGRKMKSPTKLARTFVDDGLNERVAILEAQVANLAKLLHVASASVVLPELTNSVVDVVENPLEDDVIAFDTEDNEIEDLDFSTNLFDSA